MNNQKTEQQIAKSHAKDYLFEYQNKKSTSKWLALLIQKVIDTNAKISENEKNQIYIELLKANGIEVKQGAKEIQRDSLVAQQETSNNSKKQKFTLQKITHIKGVNALIPNQSIIFSQACTIIYGLNGTGKSGYFRIINEIAGGIKTKDILGNIHKQDDNLEVDVDFLLDDKAQIKWKDKALRGISPFNKVNVFDSEYLPIFLNERESTVNIEPLGLNFFQIITTIIDEFKEKLNQAQQEKQNLSPDLQPLIDIIHSEDLKKLLWKNSLTEQEKQYLNDYKIFTDEEAIKLKQLKQDKINIEKNPTEDSKQVLAQDKEAIDDLKEQLLGFKKNLEELTKNTSSAVNNYLEKKKDRDDRANEFEVLKNIPSQNTERWQAFIESAKEYGETLDHSTLNKDEQCIYCHQPLDKDAIKLIQAYSQYLDDQSQQNFKITEDKISVFEKKISNLADFLFSETLNKILVNLHNEQKQNYKTLVEQVIQEGKKQKITLEQALKGKTLISEKFTLDLLKVDKKLEEISEKKQIDLNNLKISDTQKTKKISALEREINKLQDKQIISSWKTKIDNYFLTCQLIQKYETANKKINTREITKLGSKAHGELLTDSIRQCFEDELKALGKNIEVKLEKTGAGKGSVRTRLKILGNNVRDILSEGEQKAVGLALFLAEIENQKNKYPIVFDDPVTSFDHETSDLLAKKLLQLSLDRQIIIFTHNKLFYDSLIYWSKNLKDEEDNKTHHVCKNYTQKGCHAKGCHVYTYKVDRESKNKTGRIFEAQNESCRYYIKKAENEIKSNDFLSSSVAGYLKSAIEYYIDEKILNKQGLIKDKKIKDHIEWEMLKGLNPDKDIINQLKIYWDDLSSRGTHLSASSSENPLKIEDLNNIIQFLKI
jgi:energy-coupling factor transporter ATP-binding protein EcfA2